MAFELAETMKISHKFNRESRVFKEKKGTYYTQIRKSFGHTFFNDDKRNCCFLFFSPGTYAD